MRLNAKNTTETTVETGELRSEAHNFTVDGDGEIPPRERANFDCPQCDREVVPGPWNSWLCWGCGDVIYVEGGDRR